MCVPFNVMQKARGDFAPNHDVLVAAVIFPVAGFEGGVADRRPEAVAQPVCLAIDRDRRPVTDLRHDGESAVRERGRSSGFAV